jgi:crossover junction endodeoxyribonuclease RuvC
MLVLGIDPGLAATGYGLVNENGGKLEAVEFGVIRTSAETPLPQRLHTIVKSLEEILKLFKPECASVERVFAAANIKTALLLGHVRGAILAELCRQGLQVLEYSALQIKQAVVGYGKADKKQVAEMVRILLNLAERPRPTDAADALAAAICHLHSCNSPLAREEVER